MFAPLTHRLWDCQSGIVLAVITLNLRTRAFGEAPHLAADFAIRIFDRNVVTVVVKPSHIAGLAVMRPGGPHRDAWMVNPKHLAFG
jgi:hypothetical protein